MDPLTVTIAAAVLTSSGLLSDGVRALLASIFRRPRKTSLLVRHGDGEYLTIDLDDQTVAHLNEQVSRMGLSSAQAAALVESIRGKLKSATSGDKPASDRRGEADDVH